MAARHAGYISEEDASASYGTPGQHQGDGNMYRRNRPVSGVSFQQRLSVYSATGTEIELFDLNDQSIEDDSEDIAMKPKHWWMRCIENSYFKFFFRLVSVINLIVLIFCVPLYNLNDLDDSKKRVVTIQFKVVTVIDFILSCIYTCHLIIRMSYYVKVVRENNRKRSSSTSPDMILDKQDSSNNQAVAHQSITSPWRILTLFLLTISMWYAVGIGVYRSINTSISLWWYIGFTPRAILAIFPALNLLLKVESSAFEKLSGLLKWKQLTMVTGFYFIFVFIFALMGVHVIGGLDHVCMERTIDENGNYSISPAIPITHCNPNDTSRQFHCDIDQGDNTGLVCLIYPPDHDGKLFFDYRSYVYYGQYTVILDALFAVYEASTLELWSFMMINAIDTHGALIPVAFYFLLVLFVVILLQQSIFLVVIIESFAGLREKSSYLWKKKLSLNKGQTKPATVLTLENPDTTRLTLRSLVNDTSPMFLNKYGKFLVRFEKFFLLFVAIDALVTATKHANMKYNEMKLSLIIWEVSVSVLFFLEICFILLFHLYHGQWKLFFRRPYYIYLIVLAIGGLLASLPLSNDRYYIFFDPHKPASALAIFQALRFMRLLKSSQSLFDFAVKITGKSIPILSVITLIVICWLAVFNAQLFGYNNNYPEECNGIGEEHFGTFLESFQSTFQLVMNEGWTDIFSEVMCRSSYWFVTNLYFIVIHLFSSLIFLNFFGAVILDNLEYDEEEKKTKLEEFKKKEAEFNETVPYRLKIFKKLGNEPKKLKPPPGIGGDDPKLDEFEVRKFFEAASTNNLVDNSDDLELTDTTNCFKTTDQRGNRRPSLLRQLSLMTPNKDELIPSETTPELHGIYQSINSLLQYISVWRKYNEEEQSKDPRSSNIHYLFGQSPYERKKYNVNNRNVKSEYDIFREKHRFFDLALFCMPPEHKLRKFCTTLLTAQAQPPHYAPIQDTDDVMGMFKKRISFITKWFISRMPYSTWIFFLGLCIVVNIQMVELSYQSYHPEHTYTVIVEILYVTMILTWLILKVISRGLFLNPHAAISSIWDVIDWILVLDSGLLLALLPLWSTATTRGSLNIFSIDIRIFDFPLFYKCLYIIRCLRPLHLISVLDSLRSVVREIVEGWRNLLKAVVLLVGFLFMFASLGVQLFAGTGEDNPLAFCNDPSKLSKTDCIGEFKIVLDISREFLPLNSSFLPVVEILVPRVWYPQTRDFPFSNVAEAFVTLFELLTLEGWPNVRDMFSGRNDIADVYMKLYIHIFLFFAVNIGLQLFLGIVVNNFNEHKPGHTFLLTVEQNRWAELMQRISLQRPDKLPQEPRTNPVRLRLYNFLISPSFRRIPTVVIALSVLTLIVPWDPVLIREDGVIALISLSILLNLYTILEMFLKLLAFGPAYFQSWRNLFDFILSLATLVYTVCGLVVLAMSYSSYYKQLSYFALGIGVMKLMTVMLKYRAMLNLLVTVFTTILRSLSLLTVFIVICITYSLLGVAFFSNVRTGEAFDLSFIGFQYASTSLNLVWRAFTGEDWYQLMWDAAVRPPYCDDDVLKNCGDPVIAVLYFCSFTFIVPFILLNVFIAVLLENFAIFYNDEETNLDLVAMKDFKRKWRIFDLNAKGRIPMRRVKLLLRSLDMQSYYTFLPPFEDIAQTRERVVHQLIEDPLLLWEMEEELRQGSLSFVNKTVSSVDQFPSRNSLAAEISVEFLNVLRMLAYRCEDIYKRLEPQELFTRKEMEQTLQLDVAEKCILMWLRKKAKPIVEKQIEESKAAAATGADVGQDERTVSISEKRQHLLALHSSQSQFLDVKGWGKQHSLETEDEDIAESKGLSWSQQLHASSEERIDQYSADTNTNQLSESCTRSFNKMVQRSKTGSSIDREKAQEWFKIQEEWMDKVNTDYNYFDDQL